MKNHSLKRISMIALLIGSFYLPGHAKTQEGKESQLFPFYHNCAGIRALKPVQIICKPDHTAKYLELHRKYDFTYDEQNRVTQKEAYKWDLRNSKWIPDYIQTFTYDKNLIETHYAKWNKRKKSYDPSKEKVIYKTCDSGISAYTSYKRFSPDNEWKLVTDLSDLLPNQLIAEK